MSLQISCNTGATANAIHFYPLPFIHQITDSIRLELDFFFYFNQKYVRPELITSVSNYFTIHLNLDRWESVLVDSSGQQLPHTDAHKSLSVFTLIFLSFLLHLSIATVCPLTRSVPRFLFLLMSLRSLLFRTFLLQTVLSLSIPSQPSPV